jgi:hypothetical protein
MPRQSAIDERNQGRQQEEGWEQRHRAVEHEVEVAGERRHEDAEKDSADARVGGRAGVRNHEEREEKKAAVLKLVQRNGDGVAEPEGATKGDACVSR